MISQEASVRLDQVFVPVHPLEIRWFHPKSFTKSLVYFLAGCECYTVIAQDLTTPKETTKGRNSVVKNDHLAHEFDNQILWVRLFNMILPFQWFSVPLSGASPVRALRRRRGTPDGGRAVAGRSATVFR
jgi:hypothetical protein